MRRHARAIVVISWVALLAVTLSTVLVLTGALALPAARAMRATSCTVGGSGAEYPSIAAAIQGNCTDLQVAPGTYTEQITSSNPPAVTITGAGVGQTVIQPTGTLAFAANNGQQCPILQLGGGSQLSGVTIDGANASCGMSNGKIGIDIFDGGTTVSGVLIKNIDVAIGSSDGGSGNGQTITISGSTLYAGVGVLPPSSPLTFKNNTVIGNGSTEQVGLFGGTTVTGNTFKNFHTTPCSGCVPGGEQGEAIATGQGTISNNTFLNSDNGILVENAPQAVTISGNTFSGVSSPITLGLNWHYPVTVRGNHISNVPSNNGGWPYYAGVGIGLCGENGDTISNNTISGAAYGIAAFAYQTQQCASTGPGTFPTAHNTISGNTISGSSRADLLDTTRGNGTAGTANSYSGNSCAASQPGGLCAGSAAAAPTATALVPTPASGEAAPTYLPAARAGRSAASSSASSSGGAPILLIVGGLLLVLVAAGGGGTLTVVALRRRRGQRIMADDRYDYDDMDTNHLPGANVRATPHFPPHLPPRDREW